MLASLNLEPIALAAGSVHRIENAKGVAARRIADAVAGKDTGHAVVRVESATLFQSVTGPAGPRYAPLMRIPLQP